jgi:hypothetical protein
MMFRTLRISILSVVGGLALLAALVSGNVAPRPALAQGAPPVPSGSLSPHEQQVLLAVLQSMPPAHRQLTLNALQRLSPQQVRAAIAYIQSIPPDALAQAGQVLAFIVEALPPNLRQTFVNGVWGVSPQETQFANQVMLVVAQTIGASGGGQRGPTTAPPGPNVGLSPFGPNVGLLCSNLDFANALGGIDLPSYFTHPFCRGL